MNFTIHRATGEALDLVRDHCEHYHYLRRWPDARSLPFGYCLTVDDQVRASDGRLWGLVVFKKPQHHQQRGLFGYAGLPTAWQVLDLARVWIHPQLQGNGYKPGGLDQWIPTKNRKSEICTRKLNVFSRMMRLLFRQTGHERLCPVQRDWLDHHPPRYPEQPYHIEVIISYCDLRHHDGKAYKASGFTWNGYGGRNRSKEVYYRKLRPPQFEWHPTRPAQLPLLPNFPLIHNPA